MRDSAFFTTIESEAQLTAASFYKDFVIPQRAVLIKGAIQRWEALRKWTPDYFSEIGGSLKFPVKTKDVSEGKTTQVYLDSYIQELNEYENKLGRGEAVPGSFPYLHDIPIFNLMPELAKDVKPFPSSYFPGWYHENILQYAQFFMSATGSVTPLHFDTLYTHNLFFQVYGVKQFILIPSQQRADCYLHGWRWGQVNAECPDYSRFPHFKRTTPVRLIIEPGDMLFMPSGTLHEVKTLRPSISFNIDWHTRKTALKGLISGLEGAPLKNVFYNALICAGLYLKIPPEKVFPYYKSYLSYIS